MENPLWRPLMGKAERRRRFHLYLCTHNQDILYGCTDETSFNNHLCFSVYQACIDNTQGAYCEECAFGYHGNATEATPDACKPCACPLPIPSNNFAKGCVATPRSTQGAYLCIGCRDGYTGNFCEMLVDGIVFDLCFSQNIFFPALICMNFEHIKYCLFR